MIEALVVVLDASCFNSPTIITRYLERLGRSYSLTSQREKEGRWRESGMSIAP